MSHSKISKLGEREALAEGGSCAKIQVGWKSRSRWWKVLKATGEFRLDEAGHRKPLLALNRVRHPENSMEVKLLSQVRGG